MIKESYDSFECIFFKKMAEKHNIKIIIGKIIIYAILLFLIIIFQLLCNKFL